ncbi:MAG: hypothetical protein RR842_11025 [Gordonibacter sp.]|uniref:hypothetical protein n=1 Tax=Gordonibacter sp. TaxID=1968902 RepID=UPI002FC5DFE5
MCFRPPTAEAGEMVCPHCYIVVEPDAEGKCPECGGVMREPADAPAPGAPQAPVVPPTPGSPVAPKPPSAPR